MNEIKSILPVTLKSIENSKDFNKRDNRLANFDKIDSDYTILKQLESLTKSQLDALNFLVYLQNVFPYMIYASQSTIAARAKQAGYARETINRAMPILEDLNLLVKINRGVKRTCLYILHPLFNRTTARKLLGRLLPACRKISIILLASWTSHQQANVTQSIDRYIYNNNSKKYLDKKSNGGTSHGSSLSNSRPIMYNKSRKNYALSTPLSIINGHFVNKPQQVNHVYRGKYSVITGKPYASSPAPVVNQYPFTNYDKAFDIELSLHTPDGVSAFRFLEDSYNPYIKQLSREQAYEIVSKVHESCCCDEAFKQERLNKYKDSNKG